MAEMSQICRDLQFSINHIVSFAGGGDLLAARSKKLEGNIMNKVYAAARALALLLAIAAAFVAIPNLNVAAALVILGIITGIGASTDDGIRIMLAVLVLPAIGVALGNIPQIGEQLGAIATNLGLNIAGVGATLVVRRIIALLKGDWAPAS
jgi:hypothetical protein